MISYFHLDVVYCKNCDLHITGKSEEIQLKTIKEFYQHGEYWDSQQTSPEHVIESNYTDMYSVGKRKQWLSQFSYCRSYLQNKKKLLEIGSGLGQTIFWFEQAGLSVTGIEPDKRNVELINKKLSHGRCLEGRIEEIDIDGEFDIIWISHVLEHLVRPDKLLAKLKKI
jgi:2-polyprenyl-3-methyl-5-hydroxy-6-metoxy-1,4-benzoquinol methylase